MIERYFSESSTRTRISMVKGMEAIGIKFNKTPLFKMGNNTSKRTTRGINRDAKK